VGRCARSRRASRSRRRRRSRDCDEQTRSVGSSRGAESQCTRTVEAILSLWIRTFATRIAVCGHAPLHRGLSDATHTNYADSKTMRVSGGVASSRKSPQPTRPPDRFRSIRRAPIRGDGNRVGRFVGSSSVQLLPANRVIACSRCDHVTRRNAPSRALTGQYGDLKKVLIARHVRSGECIGTGGRLRQVNAARAPGRQPDLRQSH
jgi:hypothetical protein